MNSDRFKRQAKRVIQEKISSTPVTIIGTGAIGREIALKLAQMGTSHLQLVDFDIVEETNICTQGYLEKDLGRPKIEALKDSCISINSNISISLINQRFSPMNTKLTPVTFSCVDKMKPRTQIWNFIKNKSELFIDTRMSAEVARIITITPSNKFYYETTLFNDKDAYQDGCTQQSTCYCASIAAGIAVSQLAMWTRELELEKDITYNILATELDIE